VSHVVFTNGLNAGNEKTENIVEPGVPFSSSLESAILVEKGVQFLFRKSFTNKDSPSVVNTMDVDHGSTAVVATVLCFITHRTAGRCDME